MKRTSDATKLLPIVSLEDARGTNLGEDVDELCSDPTGGLSHARPIVGVLDAMILIVEEPFVLIGATSGDLGPVLEPVNLELDVDKLVKIRAVSSIPGSILPMSDATSRAMLSNALTSRTELDGDVAVPVSLATLAAGGVA